MYQGDYNRETVFSDDPLDVALKWQSMGAPRLHIVDLDGAASGEIRNLEVIRNIAKAMLIPVQIGGGIRDKETVQALLNAKWWNLPDDELRSVAAHFDDVPRFLARVRER